MAGITLTPGARLLLDGGTWTIRDVNYDAQYCVLDDGVGTQVMRSFAEVVTSTTLSGIGEKQSNDHLWRRVPKGRRDREQLKLDHVREAETGYRSGDHRDALPGEPRPQYDPAKTTITQRRFTKAAELGDEGFRAAGLSMSYKTLERKGAEYRKHGTSSLLDRRLAPRRRGHSLTEDVERACLSIDQRLRASSNVTNTTRYRLIRSLLSTSGYTGPVPSQSTVDRWFATMTDGASVRGKAKYRDRTAAPSGGYRPPVPTRPGELVYLDTYSLDVLLAGTAFAGTIRGSVVAAIDVYSRSILAVRVQEGMEKSIDVTFLLRDIMRPVHMRPEWKDDRRWAYVGIPAAVLLDSGIATDTVSALPIAHPETVVMDHGTTYKSKLTLAACESLGISVAPSRKGRGSDKAVIERFFGTLKTSLLQMFPTYLGADPSERARHLEQQPALNALQLEQVIQRWVIEWWQQHVMAELRPDWCPEGKFSPEALYSYGLAQTGVALRVPTQLEYLKLLPHVTVDITDRGVKVLGLHYDDPSLIDLRGRPAPHGGHAGGKWAVSYDPRDLRRVWLVDDRDAIRELSWTRTAHEIPAFNVADAKAMRDTAKAMGLRRRTNEDLLQILLDIVGTDVPGYVDPKTRGGAPKTRAVAPKKTREVVKASRSEFGRQRLASDQASFAGLTPDEPDADTTGEDSSADDPSAEDSSGEDSSGEDASAFPQLVPFKAQPPATAALAAAPAPRPQSAPARRSILFPRSEETP